jgi:CHAD domain-containing protein
MQKRGGRFVHAAFRARMCRWLSAKRWRQESNGRRKSLEESVGKLTERWLEKRHKTVLKLGRDFENLSPEARHRLLALKKLRYTAEFFHSLYQKKRENAYLRALAQLQKSLGHMNDIVTAEHLLERLTAAREDQSISDNLPIAVGIVAGWHAHKRRSQLARILCL